MDAKHFPFWHKKNNVKNVCVITALQLSLQIHKVTKLPYSRVNIKVANLGVNFEQVVRSRSFGLLEYFIKEYRLDLKLTELTDVATARNWLLNNTLNHS